MSEVVLTQKNVRERLLKIISEGMNQKYISQQSFIAQSSLSKYKNSKLNLTYPELESLSNFLISKGY
jgi:hypothetical protein